MSSLCTATTALPRRLMAYMYDMSLSYSSKSIAAPTVKLTKALLELGDDSCSNAIIAAFAGDPAFTAFAQKETDDIMARDAEDGEKLAAGILMAVEKGVLAAEPPVEPVCKIDVAGKSADAVCAEIIAKLGAAAEAGCVLVLQGLSGTGKGTTVAKLQSALPRATSWSNGNVFRSLTLLAVSYCEAKGVEFSPDHLTPFVLAELMSCLHFGKFEGIFDIHIKGWGHDSYVSKIQNTTLKDPKVGKNIPTVAKMTQGEVVTFASNAAASMQADGMNVLIEGRSQTLDYVRSPHRFELTLAEPLIIGQRRAAQRMMGATLTALKDEAAPSVADVEAALKAALDKMAA